MAQQTVITTTDPDLRLHHPRGVVLAALATSMFVVVLDQAMVNLTGLAIREGLGLSAGELTLVVDSYLVAFAGLLLLGGRLADVLGARRVHLIGMSVYVAASALCALAVNGPMLIAGRIGQGIGAALVIPAALALLLAVFRSPAERTRAMGVWGAVAGAGSLTGVFLGGTMTDILGWPSVFWAPVPVGIATALVVWRTLPAVPGRPGRFDAAGAITITVGITALVLGLVSAAEAGWAAPGTLAGIVVGLAGLLSFFVIERRATDPLVPLTVFGRRPVVVSSVVVLLLGATMTSVFFFLPLYQQGELGMDAMTTGMTQIPIAVTIVVGSVLAPLAARVLGLVRAIRIALVMLVAGLLWLVLDPTTSGFSGHLLGSFVLIGGGLGLGGVNAMAMAVRDSGAGESGLLSGLINAAQQLGGAVGLAALAGIAIGTAGSHDGIAFSAAFLGGAGLIVAALGVSLIPSRRRPPSHTNTHVPTHTDTATHAD